MAHRDEYTYEEEQQILLDLEEKAYEEQLLTAQEMDLCNNCIELECEDHGYLKHRPKKCPLVEVKEE